MSISVMLDPLPCLLAFWTPGPLEFGILAVLGLLLFGRRLPEVGRSLGRSIVEFKKGIKGIEDEIDSASSERPAELPDRQRDERKADSRTVSTADRVDSPSTS